MDPLADIVTLLRPQTLLWKCIEANGRWALRFPDHREPHFGLVVAGRCWLRLSAEPATPLQEGDYVLLPSSRSYSFFSDPGVPAVPSDDAFRNADEGRIRLGDGGDDTACRLVGGQFRFAPANAGLLLSFLPDLVHIRSSDDGAEQIRTIMALIGQEASSMRPGGELILSRLVEIMLVEALRSAQAMPDAQPKGMLGGLASPQIARALHKMHADVQHPWTVEELASAVGLSRSVFSRRFSQAVGSAPIDYLLNWRMALAKDRLISGKQSITGIADSVGYQSASAFSTAFARIVGCPPARFAVHARTAGRN
ncbi:MAG: AraC family transcriptional regulator [Pseudomonadota bacterium]|nr:AraC family transcriptional regulator [Pseudomonadota bacterium]